MDWLLFFERIAYRVPADALAPDAAAFASDFDDAPDLVVDLAGDAPASATPVLRLCWPEGPGEVGLIAALLDGATPAPSFVLEAEGWARTVLEARLAVERPGSLAASFDAAAKRLATLIAQAVSRCHGVECAPHGTRPARLSAVAPLVVAPLVVAPLAFAVRSLAARIANRIADRARRGEHWRIALRRVEGPGVTDTLSWAGGNWRGLADDGARYYADPFLFAHGGRRWLFCEEYPYATAKGILSVAAIDAEGRPGRPRPCLEAPTHLSWPQVFAHGGAVYMIPESAGAGRVELWRATDFPQRWTLDCVLIDAIRAHDPLLRVGPDGAYLLATLDDDGGSSWDALGLFAAPSLHGPWRACGDHPILVDASAARPAGPFVAKADGLWRPAQDCRGGYGAGLAVCRVTRLDAGGYAQEVAVRLGPPPLPGAEGAHSLCRLGDLEAIDVRGARLILPA